MEDLLASYRFFKTTFWIIVMIYLGVIGIYLLIKAMKMPEEAKSQKQMHRAWALFMFLYILTRFFFLLSDFENDAYGQTLLHYRFVAIAYTCFILAFWSMIFWLKNTH